MNTPAPGRVKAAARARAARRRTKHNRWAEELQQDGWTVIPPEKRKPMTTWTCGDIEDAADFLDNQGCGSLGDSVRALLNERDELDRQLGEIRALFGISKDQPTGAECGDNATQPAKTEKETP